MEDKIGTEGDYGIDVKFSLEKMKKWNGKFKCLDGEVCTNEKCDFGMYLFGLNRFIKREMEH